MKLFRTNKPRLVILAVNKKEFDLEYVEDLLISSILTFISFLCQKSIVYLLE